MTAKLHQACSILLVFLLALTSLAAPGVPAASSQTQAPQAAIPGGLTSAFLIASSRPFQARGNGFAAVHDGLTFDLRAGGLQASGAGIAWGLALSGLGRGNQITSVSEAKMAQTASRLEYRRGALTEWYRHTALGLEQGFTIHQAPRGAGPLLLQLDLATGLAGAPDADGRGLSFAAPGGQTLRYDHLRAADANGAELDASLRYTPGLITLQVNDQGAAYPITIDPLVSLEQKVVAEDGAANDIFGHSVALSGDGNWALVGASSDDVGAYSDQGSAYVFVRSGMTWSGQQQLTALDGKEDDSFGISVALSDDGSTALVGAAIDTVGANQYQGSAYVFTRSGTTWSEQQQLTASDGAAADWFGFSVALSGDGNTALVGAIYHQVGANPRQGSAYVFVREETTWKEVAQLAASDGVSDVGFGGSVALSGDGNTALVGAVQDQVGANLGQGSAYVFARSGTTWGEQAKLTASDGARYAGFGGSVALSGDTALVGAFQHDVGAHIDQGSAYVFMRDVTTWQETAQFIASDGAGNDYFGRSVALSGDGNTALVGASQDQIGTNQYQGSVYVFTGGGTTWSEQGKLTASDGAGGDFFGVSVALSGHTALVGALQDDVGANIDQGSAYFYDITISFAVYLPMVLRNVP